MNIPISTILVEDRQRFDLGDIERMKASLTKFGQLQPILLRKSDNRLINGGRRLTAAKELGWETILAHYREDVPNDVLLELELEENVCRKDMDWHERVRAIAQIHSAKLKTVGFDPSAWGQAETGELLGIAVGNVNYALKLSGILANPSHPHFTLVSSAESPYDALKNLAQAKEDEYLLELSKRTGENVPKDELSFVPDDEPRLYSFDEEGEVVYTPGRLDALRAEAKNKVYLSNQLFHGDCISVMHEYPPEWINHIVCDPPYAIDMEMLEQENTGMDVSRVEDEHEINNNLITLHEFLPEAFRVLKPGGFCVMWCDIMNWKMLYDRAKEVGFAVQRWPIIWDKGTGMNQAAGYNFTKSFEIAMVCRLPSATLQKPAPRSVVSSPIDREAKSLGNTFAKPALVWQFIMEHVSAPGQTILDPFAGTGSALIAALDIDRYAYGIEKDQRHYCALVENLKQWHLARNPNSVFL